MSFDYADFDNDYEDDFLVDDFDDFDEDFDDEYLEDDDVDFDYEPDDEWNPYEGRVRRSYL